MEKEIIGYKLKEEFKEYESVAAKLFNCNELFEPVGHSGDIEKLKNAKLLDLWFEPVYKEEFKVGDWVTFYSETKQCTYTDKIKDWTCHSYCRLEKGLEPFKHLLRKATPEEIEDAQIPNIVINTYKGEFFNNYVKFGCAEIDKRTFIGLDHLIDDNKSIMKSNKEIESITIGKGTFTKEQIKAIVNYYKNKD